MDRETLLIVADATDPIAKCLVGRGYEEVYVEEVRFPTDLRDIPQALLEWAVLALSEEGYEIGDIEGVAVGLPIGVTSNGMITALGELFETGNVVVLDADDAARIAEDRFGSTFPGREVIAGCVARLIQPGAIA